MGEPKQSPVKLICIIAAVAALSAAIIYTGQRDKNIELQFPQIAATNLVSESKLEPIPAPAKTEVERPRTEAKTVRRLPTARQLIRTVVTTTGRAEKADWGVKGMCSFVLTSTVVSDTKIVSKEETAGGEIKIVERRHYAIARQDLQLSQIDVALALVDTMPIEQLKPVVNVACGFFGAEKATSEAISSGIMGVIKSCDGASVRSMLGTLGVDITDEMEQSANAFVEHFAKAIFRTSEIEGKSYLITYYQNKDTGAPLRVDFTYEDGSPVQTEDEWMILRRVNAFMDANVVPNRACSPGDAWQFDASEFDCLLDPYVDGSYHGTVNVERTNDTADGDWVLEAKPTTITMVTDRGQGSGELNLSSGQAMIDGQTGLITALEMNGRGAMKNLNQHHLLFRARLEGECGIHARLTTEPLTAQAQE